jgi:hypothetical protein
VRKVASLLQHTRIESPVPCCLFNYVAFPDHIFFSTSVSCVFLIGYGGVAGFNVPFAWPHQAFGHNFVCPCMQPRVAQER